MAALEDERLAIAARVHNELGRENELSAPQARLFVRCLQTAWHVPPIKWGDAESSQQMADARRLLHVAEMFGDIQGLESETARDCYRRAAEILEWLSRAGDRAAAFAPTELLAAGAYQLGGLPAMASGLLRQAALPDVGSRLLGAFLGGDFEGVVSRAAQFWSMHPELTKKQGSSHLLSSQDPDSVDWYIVVELVRTLGLFADALRRGNEARLALAARKLGGLERLIGRASTPEMSVLMHLLRASSSNFMEATIHRFAKVIARDRPAFGTRLHQFAREQFRRSRGVLWPSQQRGITRLMESSSFALCTPTGSGKTLVANFALIKELLQPSSGDVAPLALYLVPSRALAGEVEGKLTAELGQDMTVTGLYGGSDWGITDFWLNSDRPCVLVATVEKADALMKFAAPILVQRLRLMVIDEAHQVLGEEGERGMKDFAEHRSRSFRLESFVSRIIALRPDISRIALTAVAGGAAQPVARWMEGSADAEPVGLRYRSTRQLVGALEVTPNQASRIVLDHLNGQPLFVRGRADPVYIAIKVPPMPVLPAAERASINRFVQVSALWTALHLAEGTRRILISVAQKPEQTMQWCAEALKKNAWAALGAPDVSGSPSRQALLADARATCVDYCGADSHQVILLDRGIATSHGQMPQHVRRIMTKLIEQRICAITIATATLTEGVNLPFDIILVPSLQRTSFDASAQKQVVSDLPVA
ncbi:MAG TPA: DEAD/DEAH box helicase, partial [Pseudorhodoferax sp.]|nr:DEAD/DEAH box helicase [Pseudorhodoferax sp.]